jgi:hypothetical protein
MSSSFALDKSARFSGNFVSMKTSIQLLPAMTVACISFALLPMAQAVFPPPDGGYPGFNTAEGTNALLSLSTGSANTAVGWFSLESVTTGAFNTGVGAGTLLLNTADANTAIGAAALLFNTTGSNNTAVGAAALLNNTEAEGNTAIGNEALLGNTTGFGNTAGGHGALLDNTTGFGNTANGAFALFNNTTGDHNIALGNAAGFNVTTANDVICIGANLGGANVSNSCFIGHIQGEPVGAGQNPNFVLVDNTGKLGTAAVDANGNKVEGLQPQAMLRKIEELQATVAQQRKEMEILTVELKEQSAQIQRVSAQVEARKPASQMLAENR